MPETVVIFHVTLTFYSIQWVGDDRNQTFYVLLCFIVAVYWLILPIVFRIALLTLWVSCSCPVEVTQPCSTTVNITWITSSWKHNHNETSCHILRVCLKGYNLYVFWLETQWFAINITIELPEICISELCHESLNLLLHPCSMTLAKLFFCKDPGMMLAKKK